MLKRILERICPYLILLLALTVVYQEDFLFEKVPFVALHTAGMLVKMLNVKSKYRLHYFIKELILLFFVCFTKKLIIDGVYYKINPASYTRNIVIFVLLILGLSLLEKKGIPAKTITNYSTLMIFLRTCHGLSDAIALERLIHRNKLLGWEFNTALFIFILLDPIILPVSLKIFKQKIDWHIYLTNFKRSLIFALILSLAHKYASQDNYASVIDIRRQYHFKSQNVIEAHVGIRMVNCILYIMLISIDYTTNRSPKEIKENVDENLMEKPNNIRHSLNHINGIHSRKNSGSVHSRKNSGNASKAEPQLELDNKPSKHCPVTEAEKSRMESPETRQEVEVN